MKKNYNSAVVLSSYNNMVPNRQLVEVTAESNGRRHHAPYGQSDGAGYFARYQSDTPSEDSSSFKRKAMELNTVVGQRTDSIGIPLRQYVIERMPKNKLGQLKKRLMAELEDVRSVKQKIEYQESHNISMDNGLPAAVTGHSSSNLKPVQPSISNRKESGFARQMSLQSNGSRGAASYEREKKPPKISKLQPESDQIVCRNTNILGKQPQKGAVAGVKRVAEQGFESDKKKPRAEMRGQYFKQCNDILKSLMSHKFGWVFNEPVDPVKLNIPDYFNIIRHPMDLGTVKKKLERDRYHDPKDFAADVRLTFHNAKTYNPPGNDVNNMAKALNATFEKKWKVLENKMAAEETYISMTQITKDVQPVLPKKQQSVNHIANRIPMEEKNRQIERKPKKDVRSSSGQLGSILDHNPVPEKVKVSVMSVAEKEELTQDLNILTEEGHVPGDIFSILQKPNFSVQREEELEIDLDAMDDDTLLHLRSLVSNHLSLMKKAMNNTQNGHQEYNIKDHDVAAMPSQIECVPDKPSKDGEAVEEDVDIVDVDVDVGNNPMETDYPQLIIEKDAAATTKCSSSGSSSSESASSSSSDSGSKSSSEEDRDGDEVNSSGAQAKIDDDDNAVQLRGHSEPDTTGAKRTASVLDEENVQLKALNSDIEAHQEGESAPPERQVSPDKQIRAAMMRKRFADTIVKAQEKTLDKTTQREKEELEKWQRKEKARIQAEAMAAEEEVAAEARRKREREREAARQALQQMEKSVDIYENSQILKDLEQLSNVHEQIHSSGDENSPARVLQLQTGDNPLEKLGLFMKVDEEEEEGNTDFTTGNGDVEEGEID